MIISSSESTINMNNINEQSEKYIIVEYPEEEEDGTTPTSIISSTWIIDPNSNPLRCYWLGYISKESERIKAVINHTQLNVRQCDISEIKILYTTVKYSRAVEKMKCLQLASSVSQTEESGDECPTGREICQKRKRQKKVYEDYEIRSNYSDSDDGITIPKPPKLPINYLKKTEDNNSTPYSASEIRSKDLTIEDNNNMKLTKTRKKLVFTGSPRNSLYSTPWPSPLLSSIGTMRNSSVQSSCSQCHHNEGSLKEIMRCLNEVKSKIGALEEKISYLINTNVTTFSEAAAELSKCNCKEELDEFDQTLSSGEKMSSVVSACQVLGGKDGVDATYRILSKIMSHELSLRYNWSEKNKFKFGDLTNVVKMITITVRRNPFAATTTSKQVEDYIKVWLRNAGDREGGRTKRKTRAEDQ